MRQRIFRKKTPSHPLGNFPGDNTCVGTITLLERTIQHNASLILQETKFLPDTLKTISRWHSKIYCIRSTIPVRRIRNPIRTDSLNTYNHILTIDPWSIGYYIFWTVKYDSKFILKTKTCIFLVSYTPIYGWILDRSFIAKSSRKTRSRNSRIKLNHLYIVKSCVWSKLAKVEIRVVRKIPLSFQTNKT